MEFFQGIITFGREPTIRCQSIINISKDKLDFPEVFLGEFTERAHVFMLLK
jgi:hypothetical protein